ncbi:hypothetical protein [Leptodesmis sp.]|uniref:hypothetical protein n=1 Tax=Leptodesmis sp. TaxID=3100501 RepID=UPI004053467D
MQTYASTRSTLLRLQPTLAWTAILGLIGFSVLCLLVHAGGLLRLAYPAGALVVGILLYQRYPILYLGYTWWVAFLTPFLHRLIDFQSDWLDPNPVLLAPFLVIFVTAMTFVQQLPRVYRRDGLPFILATIAIVYGLLVGLIRNPLNSKSVAFGTPEPLGIRVFSTMNSPGPFATVMMAGLVLLFTSRSSIRFVGAGAGYRLFFCLLCDRPGWGGLSLY